MISDLNHADSCGATPLDWAALVTNAVTVLLSWWAFEVPKLFRNGGIRQYWNAISWGCLRLCMPSVAAITAVSSTSDRKAWLKRYYYGLSPDGAEERLTKIQSLKSGLTDALVIVSTVSSLYTLHSTPESQLSGWNSSLWSFPSCPAAIYGIWISLASRTKLTPGWTLGLGLLWACAIGAGVGYAVSQIKGSYAIGTIGCYVAIALPWGYISFLGPLMLVTLVITVFARIGGVAAGALSPDAYFPFCALKGPALAAPYIAMGGITGVLSLFAFFRSLMAVAGGKERRVQQSRGVVVDG
ncbi:hypothetical protein H2200_013157 [Cladophialophora chaetospira]|uniref:Uncharacterized protein n=1 Tax=Cladophialophora chaetospira TaxID=386627 RepID=A0AA39CBH3_9EURO|nr:hypothetical protein H2200_013157 [Cladophialophora chaetospira]